jgi:carbamoyltransferase
VPRLRRHPRLEDLDAIVFYDKPWVKFERMMETYLGYAPRGLRLVR